MCFSFLLYSPFSLFPFFSVYTSILTQFYFFRANTANFRRVRKKNHARREKGGNRRTKGAKVCPLYHSSKNSRANFSHAPAPRTPRQRCMTECMRKRKVHDNRFCGGLASRLPCGFAAFPRCNTRCSKSATQGAFWCMQKCQTRVSPDCRQCPPTLENTRNRPPSCPWVNGSEPMEHRGFEPLTCCVRCNRSTN